MFRNSNKMKVLKHLLFLGAVIITGRADVIPERTRRDGNQLPVSEKVGPYGSSSVNPNTEPQLSVEIEEDDAYNDYGLLTPSGVGGLNEEGEFLRAEAKAVAGYDGEGQLNGGNIVDEYGLAPPSAGFGYGNQFKTAALASASAEVHTRQTAANSEPAQVDATTQAKLHAQFGKGAQHGLETQTDTIIQENSVQYDNATKVQTPKLARKPHNILMNYRPAPSYVEPDRGIWPGGPLLGTFIGKPQVDTDPSSLYYNGPPVYKHAQHIPPSVPITDTRIEKFKPMANEYEVTQSPNWIKKGIFNNNFNWSPHTKPAEGESFVQADGIIEADALAQENGEPPYQEETQANSMVHASKGVEVTAANADAEAKTYAGYNTQSGVIAQINSGTQYETSALADAVVQKRGRLQYSGENKLTSSAQANAEFQTNVAPSYSGGSQHNGAHYVGGSGTKGATQTSEGIKYGAKYSESALYADTGKFNGGSLNGGFHANAKSHLQSGVQFGGAVGAEALAQAGIVLESRFGQSTHPPRRPGGFGYRNPNNFWNHG